MKQNGFIKKVFELERSNFRSHIDTQVTKDISVSLNVAGKINDYYQPGGDSYENQTTNNVVGVLLLCRSVCSTPNMKGCRHLVIVALQILIMQLDIRAIVKIRTMRLETSAKIEYSFPSSKV
ncbi:hypothetical protein NXW20_00080 [Bacteroides faecis]|nr:hypothetical protein [Bacteroides faecis]MCS2194141.1 hypothetical protein [Bacteroides faecis]